MAAANVGMEVSIKFGDSTSNGFRDIRGADFVSNERRNQPRLAKPIPIARNGQGVSSKNALKGICGCSLVEANLN